MGKRDNLLSLIGCQIVETGFIPIYTKFRAFQQEWTKLVRKHPVSSLGVAQYTEPESNWWWEGGKTMVVAEEKGFYIPWTSLDEIPQLPI